MFISGCDLAISSAKEGNQVCFFLIQPNLVCELPK